MKKIAFFDTKPYDRTWFDILAKHYEIAYFEEKLNRHTATLTDGFDAVCAFVNDRVDAAAIDRMHRCGVQLLALRCAGFSNVDMQAAAGKLRVRANGSAGTHNGMRNIVYLTGSQAFPRVRVGIGKPEHAGQELAAHVLGKYPPEQRQLMFDAFTRAADAIRTVIADGVDKAMAQYNG